MEKEPATLSEFFQEFIRKHSKTNLESGMIVLDIKPEEIQVLGRSVIFIMVGWAADLERSRSAQNEIPLPDWLKPVDIVNPEETERTTRYECKGN